MPNYNFVIEYRIKPYVRMTQRSKYVDKQAGAYLNSKRAIQLQMRTQMNISHWRMFENKEPLFVSISLFLDNRLHGGDLDNYVKAILDAGNNIIYQDDRYVDRIFASRYLSEHNRCYLMVEDLKDEETNGITDSN